MQKSAVFVVSAVTLLSACVTTQPQAPTSSLRQNDVIAQCANSASLYTLNSVLWEQTAVEYRASAAQTYTVARMALDRALADPTWTALPGNTANPALPPAIALDLDETAFDNSAYQARLLKRGITHTEEEFDKFEAEGAGKAIEGSRDFLQYAASRGVKVFYITNRNDLEGGRKILRRLGFPLDDDALLFKEAKPEWTSSDKTSRREWVASRYRLLLLLGDDFNDFVAANGKTLAQRDALYEQYKSFFGTKWFVLPNAMYGSWENSITAGAKTLEEKCAAKYRLLDGEEAAH
jgi:acid phosphatase